MDCSICDGAIEVTGYGWPDGNSAEPVNDGRCCNYCNWSVVIPARLDGFSRSYVKEVIQGLEKKESE